MLLVLPLLHLLIFVVLALPSGRQLLTQKVVIQAEVVLVEAVAGLQRRSQRRARRLLRWLLRRWTTARGGGMVIAARWVDVGVAPVANLTPIVVVPVAVAMVLILAPVVVQLRRPEVVVRAQRARRRQRRRRCLLRAA